MGLFSTTHIHNHRSSGGGYAKIDATIVEKKAPTDESIRLLNEMQDKVVQNLIAKVEVRDNLLDGTVHAFNNLHTTMQYMVTLIFKFKINGKEFVIEKKIKEDELFENGKDIHSIEMVMSDYAKSVMIWYALKMFTSMAYEQITNKKVPEYLLK